MTNQGGEGDGEKFFPFSGEAPSGGEAEPAAEVAEDQSESTEEFEEPPLFTEGDGAEPALELEEEAPEEPEVEAEEEKQVSQTTLRERLAKQKDSLERKHGRELQKRDEELREAKQESVFGDALRAMYPGKTDPFGSFVAEKLVLDAMVELQTSGWEGSSKEFLKTAVANAKARSKGETVTVTKTEAPEKTSDKRVDTLMKTVIADKVETVVNASVKPEYRKALSREIVRLLGPVDDPATLRDRLEEVAPKAIRELGWTAKMVRLKPADTQKPNPVATTSRGAAKSTNAKPEAAKEKAEAPKSIREWRDQGKTLLETLRSD